MCMLVLVPLYSLQNNKSDNIEKVKTTNTINYEEDTVKVMVKEIAPKYFLDWKVVYAVCKYESNLQAKAKGDSGKAWGLMQLHIGTAKTHYDKDITGKSLLSPKININAGCSVLKDYLDRYHGNYTYAIAAYNAGPKHIDLAYNKKSIPFNKDYIIGIYNIAWHIE